MARNSVQLTDRLVAAIPPPQTGEVRVWDASLTGLFVRVYPTGRRVYALKRIVAGAHRTVTIGVHGKPWTTMAARLFAADALAREDDGVGPLPRPLMVSDLIDRYLVDGPRSKPGKRASSWKIDRSNLDRHIRPQLGSKTANEITKAEAAEAICGIIAGKTRADERTGPHGRARITGGEGTARRTKSTAAAMYAWGVEAGLVTTNPFAKIRMSVGATRQMFLAAAEARTFLRAIDDLQGQGEMSRTFAGALRLLLLTGARKSEILGLRWNEVDFAHGLLSLPPERTKAGGRTGQRHIALSPQALALLTDRRNDIERHNVFVFPSTRGPAHIVGLRKPFLQVCDAAGVTGLRIHDLRHTFASLAVGAGESLVVVGKLLGHANTRTTDRYAHLANGPLQRAVGRIGRQLMQS